MLFLYKSSTLPTNLETVYPTSLMRELWTHINVLFFGSDIPHRLSRFRWCTSPDPEDRGVLGLAYQTGPVYCIDMKTSLQPTKMLNVLIHEACHVFNDYYACHMCRTAGSSISKCGHGRAWQILVEAVERKFTEFTGFPTDLIRFGSIYFCWEDQVPLPSLHDLAEWDLGRYILNRDYKRDLKAAVRSYVRRGDRVKDFLLRKFSRHWWVDTQLAEQLARGTTLRTT
jgi:hypothetical protein